MASLNPFISLNLQNSRPFHEVIGDSHTRSGGFQENSIAIPKYVGVKGGSTESRISPVQIGSGYKLPGFIRFSVDSPVLKSYYGPLATSDVGGKLFSKLTKTARDTKGYFNFITQKVMESSQEKYQIVDTFGDSFVGFFFGRRQVVLSISGILIDDHMSDMKSEMMFIYNNFFRAHHTARHKVLTEFGYGDTTVQGVFLSLNTSTGDVQNEVTTPFSAEFLVYKFNKPLSKLDIYGKDDEFILADVLTTGTSNDTIYRSKLVGSADNQFLTELFDGVEPGEGAQLPEYQKLDANLKQSVAEIVNDPTELGCGGWPLSALRERSRVG